MPYLFKYKGHYLLKDIKLQKHNDLLLECGEALEVNVKLVDKRKMSDQQRKFIFALYRDYEDYTGDDAEELRVRHMLEVQEKLGIEQNSLKYYSMHDASELIDYIILRFLADEIPIRKKTIEEYGYQFTERQMYVMALKRVCCVCGKTHSDLHHLEHIARRGNREGANHVGLKMIPLCRVHHTEAHTIGDKAIVEKYNLVPFTIDERMQYFITKGKVKVFEDANICD